VFNEIGIAKRMVRPIVKAQLAAWRQPLQ